jgi:membrane-bound lytic murein transglycosylase D
MTQKTGVVYTIFPLLLFFIAAASVPAEAYKPVHARHHPRGTGPAETPHTEVILPKQGHAGPEVYPIDIPDHPNIRAYIDKYSLPQHLGWIRAAYERGFPYRDFIVRVLKEKEAPHELLFLPIVESEYRNNTVSRSGAAGIWQFMMNSIYPGMYVNQWMDDRSNFWKASEAAVDKLLYNYQRLRDWPLALAAYNCGLGKVTRTIEESGIHNFWELSDRGLLPRETINYVPRYMAIVSILSYPGRYGIVLPWREPVEWRSIPLQQTVDLRILAEESGVPYNILTAGNGELHYTITPPDNIPFHLKIPEEYTDQINRTLEDKNFQLLRFYMYTIGAGDTLYALALHYGVSISMISKYNPGIRPRALRVGQTIIIPALKQVQPYVSPPPPEKAPEDDLRPYTETYIVRKGDTLWSIARKHDTTVAMLSARNSLAVETVIRPGQKLMVPEE